MGINVNGTEYPSWDAVPAEFRAHLARALPDADGDGIPDLLQGAGLSGLPSGSGVIRSSTITVDGRRYDSLDDLPADIRAALRAAAVLPPSDGSPATPAAPVPPGAALPAPSTSPGVPARPVIRPGQVVLDGVPIETGEIPGTVRKKHWWQRG